MKLKIIGMALLAFAATGAFAVTNATGEPSGHFLHHGATDNAVITAHEGTYPGSLHQLEFFELKSNSHATVDPNGGIVCETSEYTGKVEATTVTAIELYPIYKKCTTTGGTPDEVKVHTNNCSYTFHSQGTRTHGTVSIDCHTGKQIEITHPNCTIKIPAQTTAATLTEGITYTEKEEGGKKTLTADVTVNTITGHHEGGLCVFLGTNHKFEMKGTVTVKGYNYVEGKATDHTLVEGTQIDITSK